MRLRASTLPSKVCKDSSSPKPTRSRARRATDSADVDTATFDNTALVAGSSATVSLDGEPCELVGEPDFLVSHPDGAGALHVELRPLHQQHHGVRDVVLLEGAQRDPEPGRVHAHGRVPVDVAQAEDVAELAQLFTVSPPPPPES